MANHQVSVEPITQTLEKNYMPYAMSVIVSRAIPEIDGFKPSHRKLLYTMYKMGLLSGGRTKSANVVGQTMKLHPHGDAAIYETLVRLTRGHAALLHPFIDSKGNFGKQYSRDMQYAASRYTEVKLDSICEELFRGMEKQVVDFVPNYDGTLQEPTLLPATFPSILVNANQGIAVGMASSICPFNLSEVCETTIALIKNPEAELLTTLKAPDFPGGAQLLFNEAEMQKLYETGRGSVRLRAKYRVDRKHHVIEIYEIPYASTVEAILDALAELVKSGKVKEISDVRDETDLQGLKIAIDYKRSADPDALMQRLFLLTPLEASVSCNFNLLVEGHPQVLGIRAILAAWLNFRRACLKRALAFDLDKKKAKRHLLEGLATLLLDIDRAIRIIRETQQEAQVIPNLQAAFDLDLDQAEAVAEIKLRHLNREYLLKRTQERTQLDEEIADLQACLAQPKRIDQLIIQTLKAVSKAHGQPRRTEIVAAEQAPELKAEDLIEDYRLKLFLTDHGYLKKIPLTSLRAAGDLKTKETDEVIQSLEASNRSELLLFSNQATVYKVWLHELKDCKPSEFGEYLPAWLDLQPDEQIVHLERAGDYEGSLLFAYRDGRVSHVPKSAYQTKTKRKKLVGAYADKSPLVGIQSVPDLEGEASDTQAPRFFLRSNLNKALIFEASQIPLKSTRSNQGIQVMTPKRNSEVVDFCRADQLPLEQPSYYQTKRLPAVGYYVKEDLQAGDQLTFNLTEERGNG